MFILLPSLYVSTCVNFYQGLLSHIFHSDPKDLIKLPDKKDVDDFYNRNCKTLEKYSKDLPAHPLSVEIPADMFSSKQPLTSKATRKPSIADVNTFGGSSVLISAGSSFSIPLVVMGGTEIVGFFHRHKCFIVHLFHRHVCLRFMKMYFPVCVTHLISCYFRFRFDSGVFLPNYKLRYRVSSSLCSQ
jgi:hypothetical protein